MSGGAAPVGGHTPGPWELGDEGVYIGSVYDADGLRVAFVYFQDEKSETGRPRQEEEANARLIAAAPDLLEALSDALDLLAEIDNAVRDEHRRNGAPQSKSVAGIIADRARAALAKAGGES